MNPSSLMPLVGHHPTRALVLEQLIFWSKSTNQTDDQGRPVIIPLLTSLGKILKRSKAALSKAISWLAEHGFLSVTKVKRGNAYRLQIRVLIRPRETVRKRQGNGEETANIYSSIPENTKNPLGQPPDGVCESRLMKGSSDSIGERLSENRKKIAEKNSNLKPSKSSAAREWAKCLREFGDNPLDHTDPKVQRHVGFTLDHLKPKNMEEFRARIEAGIERWHMHRNTVPDMKKAPAHPWVLNRHKKLVFVSDAPTMTKTVTPKPTVAEKPSEPKFTGLMGLLKKGKKKYGGTTSTEQED